MTQINHKQTIFLIQKSKSHQSIQNSSEIITINANEYRIIDATLKDRHSVQTGGFHDGNSLPTPKLLSNSGRFLEIRKSRVEYLSDPSSREREKS